MNAITTVPSPLAMKGKQKIVGEQVRGKAKRGKRVTAHVNDGQPAWVSRTPIGKQDESPMFKHVVLDSEGKQADWEHTYLGTRLIVTKDKTGTHSKYADLYYDDFEMRVIARWSNRVDDVTIGTYENRNAPGVNAAVKIAKRRIENFLLSGQPTPAI